MDTSERIDSAQRALPNDTVIALALAIVRSKPGDVSIADYISLLDRHVAVGRQCDAISSTHRFLDRSSFWQAEYERVSAKLSAAENALTDLRKEIDMKSRGKDEAARPTSASRKRRADTDATSKQRSSPAKKARSEVLEDVAPEAYDAQDFRWAGKHGDELLRSLFEIFTLLDHRDPGRPTELAYHIVRAAEMLSQVMAQSILMTQYRRVRTRDALAPTLKAMHRAASTMVAALNELGRLQGCEKVLGRSVYAMIKMFQCFLDSLDDMAAAEALNMLTPPNKPAESQPKSRKSAGTAGQQRPTICHVDMEHVSNFLMQVIALLDHGSQVHRELFEGFSYCILDRLGIVLFVSTFGHRRAASIEAEILKSVENDEQSAELSEESLERRQSRLLAPYLVKLLHGVLESAPAFIDSGSADDEGQIAPAEKRGKPSPGSALSIVAKERLQRTLVECIFGSERQGDEPRVAALKAPALDSRRIAIPRIREVEVDSWFQQEVWRMLGWEILRSDTEW